MWEWIPLIDWQNAGGSSFIELTSGLNIAFVAWDKFQEQLGFFESKCSSIISKVTGDELDENQQDNLKQHRFLRLPALLYRLVFYVTWALALLGGLTGIFMLFANRYCPHDWLLLAPIACYLIVSILLLIVVWIVLKFVRFCLWVTAKFQKATDQPKPSAKHDPTDIINAMAGETKSQSRPKKEKAKPRGKSTS